MSDSNRRDRNALVVFIAVLVAIVVIAWIEQPTGYNISQTSNSDIQDNSQQNVVPPITSVDDFDFWQDTFPNWVMAVFSIVASFISWKAVVYVRDTLVLTRDAVKAADDAVIATREIGEAQIEAHEKIILYDDAFEGWLTSGITLVVHSYFKYTDAFGVIYEIHWCSRIMYEEAGVGGQPKIWRKKYKYYNSYKETDPRKKSV